tara:strand:+ start:1276 stop:1770 length:495 start_codon:yes stop_codon:yes gene_type:complete
MIELLGNPLTQEYDDFKSLVLSDDFPWFIERNPKDDFDFYSHVFLERPYSDRRYPAVTSQFMDLANVVMNQIIDYNNLAVNCILRLNANAVHPWYYNSQNTAPHVDHDFPHYNLLVYLTNAGGDTHCEGQVHEPIEDDVILFEGEHCHRFPLRDRRVVLVATYN